MKISSFIQRAVAGLLVFASSVGAWAQVSPALDRFSLSVGTFSASPQVNATVGGTQGSMSTGTLDAKRRPMPRVSGEFLLGGNHGISWEAYRYNKGFSNRYAWRDSSNERPQSSGSADVNLVFYLDVARVGYRYWLGSANTVLGLGAGIGYYRVSLTTQVSGESTGAGSGSMDGAYGRQDHEDAVAPMLELGLRHAVNPSLRLFTDASGIYKGGSGVHGGIYNAAAGIEWLPLRGVGVSLAYAVTEVDLKRHDGGLQRFRVRFNGPVLSLTARF